MRLGTRWTVIIILFISAIVVWTWLNKKSVFSRTCNQTEAFQNRLHQLVNRIHKLLDHLEIKHFLCYESLWGQLRLGRTLPWAHRAEICLFNEDVSAIDEVYLSRMFMKAGVILQYDWSEGEYHVSEMTGLPDPHVVLIVFEKDNVINMYRRIGLTRRLLPPDCERLPTLSCFPLNLAAQPLPMKEFGGVLIPVPRENFEIQKYHYPDSWWKETVPMNC